MARRSYCLVAGILTLARTAQDSGVSSLKETGKPYPRISPDGLQMVFSTQPQEDYEDGSELGVSNLDGSEYRRLMRSRGYQYGPEWSPDGSQIAFISSYRIRQGNHYYQSYSLMTKGGPRKLSDSELGPGLPKARRIRHERVQPGDWEGDAYIYVVDRDGSNMTRLAEASSPPTWSPDSSIAFCEAMTVTPCSSNRKACRHRPLL